MQKELKFITDFTLNKVRNLGDYFTFQKLIFSEIHPSIARYVSSNIDYLIHLDREKLLSESPLDYSGSEISRFFSLISEQIKKRTKVSSSNVEEIIIKGIEFNFSLLEKPNRTLIDFIFEDKTEVLVEDILAKLDFLYYYTYLTKVLKLFLKNYKASSIDKKEFTEILNRVDQITYSENDEELIEYALNSMGDFYNIGVSDKTHISVDHIFQFLREKNLNDYMEKLEKLDDTKLNIPIKEALDILFALQVPAPVKTEEKETSGTIEIVVDEQKKKTEQKASAEKLELDEQADMDPLYNFNEEAATQKEEDKNKVLAEETEEIKNESIEFEIPDDFELSEGHHPIKHTEHHKRKKEVLSFLSDKDIEKIVASIFNDDREDFASTMEKISNSRNYEKATEVLKRTFKAYNVNPYSKEAVTLTNSVSNYFEQN